MRADRRVRRGELQRRVARRRSSPRGRRTRPGATCAAIVLGAATPRAGARTPSATGSCCSICRAIPKAPASVSQTAYADGSSPSASIPARRARPTRRLTGFVIRSNGAGSSRSAPRTAPARRSRRPTASSAPTTRSRVNARRRVPRRACGPSRWAYDPPAAPASVHGAAGRHRRARAASSRSRIDGHRSGRRPAAIEITSPTGETVRIPVRPQPDEHRCAVVPGRDEHVHSDHRHARSRASTLPPGLGGSAVRGGARPCRANGIGAPTDAVARR